MNFKVSVNLNIQTASFYDFIGKFRVGPFMETLNKPQESTNAVLQNNEAFFFNPVFIGLFNESISLFLVHSLPFNGLEVLKG